MADDPIASLPRTFPMVQYLRPQVVGRCRLVRVREDDTSLPWVCRYGFDLLFHRRRGVLPPTDAIGDFPEERLRAGWNGVMHRLFTTREGAQEVADALNAEIEDWCADARRSGRAADQEYRGHLAVFPPRRAPPPRLP